MKKPFTTRILGVNVAITNMHDVIEYLVSQLEQLRGKYVCLTNVHTTVMSHDDADYCKVQNEAFLALPDGRPLALIERLRGFSQADQTAGPDLMPAMWKATESTEITHYFYGSSPETIAALEKNLRKTYPNLKIAGLESPPFRSLSEEEDQEVINRINVSGADILWVGLGAPKQERWMYDHRDKIHALMFGVGAGFDFHAGTVKRAPKWMREHYLEWLYRLMQDPKRLWKRYVVTNTKFIFLSVADAFQWRKYQKEEKPTLLIFTQYYAPDVDDEGQKIAGWVQRLKEHYQISIICAVPSKSGYIEKEYRSHKYYSEVREDVNVLQVRVPAFRTDFAFSRRWNKLSYAWNAIYAMFRLEKQEYVFAIVREDSVNAVLGRIAQKLRKSKLILQIEETKVERQDTWTHRLLAKWNVRCCQKAEQLFTEEELENNESLFIRETIC